jgi:hypothetical protein
MGTLRCALIQRAREKEMSEVKIVSVTLGQPAIIDRQVRAAGEIVMVPEHMKAALEYVPPKEAKAAVAPPKPADNKPAE